MYNPKYHSVYMCRPEVGKVKCKLYKSFVMLKKEAEKNKIWINDVTDYKINPVFPIEPYNFNYNHNVVLLGYKFLPSFINNFIIKCKLKHLLMVHFD